MIAALKLVSPDQLIELGLAALGDHLALKQFYNENDTEQQHVCHRKHLLNLLCNVCKTNPVTSEVWVRL